MGLTPYVSRLTPRPVLSKMLHLLKYCFVYTKLDVSETSTWNSFIYVHAYIHPSFSYANLHTAFTCTQPVLEKFLQENGKASSMEFLTAAN